MEMQMSAQTATKGVRTLRALAAFAALFALSGPLTAHTAASASERVKDEVSRKPVQYQAGGNCSGAGCFRDILTTPTGKRRIELSAITCSVTSEGGQILGVRLKEKDIPNDLALELNVGYNGTKNSKKYYTATSTARVRLQKSTAYEMLAVSSTEVSWLKCSAMGEEIRYSQ